MGFLYLQFSSFKDLFIEKIMGKYTLKFWSEILWKKNPIPTPLKNCINISAFYVFN